MGILTDIRDSARAMIGRALGYQAARSSRATPPSVGSGRSWTEPPRVDEHTLLRLYNTSIEFRTVVGRIAQSFESAVMYPTRDGDPLPEDHPVSLLWRRPNDVLTGSAVRHVESVWLDTLDISYARLMIVDRRPLYYPVCPLWVEAKYDGERGRYYRVTWPDGSRDEYDAAEIVEMKHPDAMNPYGKGTGRGFAASDEIETSEYAARHTKASFYNGAMPDAIIGLYTQSSDGEVMGPSIEDAERMRQAWLQRNQGVLQSHGVEFVRGKVDVAQLQPALRDLVIPELRKMNADLVRQLYGVPPELIGQLEHSNRSTIDEALAIFSIMTLIPKLDFYCDQWNEQVLPKLADLGVDTRGIKIAYDSPVPEDKITRKELMAEHPWAFTVNEIRDLAGLPARTDGEVYMREAGVQFVPAGQTADQREQAEQRASAERERVTRSHDPVIAFLIDDTHHRNADPAIDAILAQLQPDRIETAYRDHTQRTIETWALAAATETGFGLSYDVLNPFVLNYVEERGAEMITLTSATTKDAVRGALAEGIAKGEGARELTRRVEELSVFARSRAELIAVTETNRAANAAKLHAYQLNPAVDNLQWSTSFANSRAWHISMNGQIRPVGEPFVSGRGGTALAPGGFGSAAEDCRCKCTIFAVIPDAARTAEERLAVQKSFEAQTEDAARALADDIYAALRHQLRRQLIPAIESFYASASDQQGAA